MNVRISIGCSVIMSPWQSWEQDSGSLRLKVLAGAAAAIASLGWSGLRGRPALNLRGVTCTAFQHPSWLRDQSSTGAYPHTLCQLLSLLQPLRALAGSTQVQMCLKIFRRVPTGV